MQNFSLSQTASFDSDALAVSYPFLVNVRVTQFLQGSTIHPVYIWTPYCTFRMTSCFDSSTELRSVTLCVTSTLCTFHMIVGNCLVGCALGMNIHARLMFCCRRARKTEKKRNIEVKKTMTMMVVVIIIIMLLWRAPESLSSASSTVCLYNPRPQSNWYYSTGLTLICCYTVARSDSNGE